VSLSSYASSLTAALVSVGIDERQARDCANNIAGPLAWMPELSVRSAVMDRLYLQRAFGLQLGEGSAAIDLVECACDACERVERFSDPLPDERPLHSRFTALPAAERTFARLAEMNGGAK